LETAQTQARQDPDGMAKATLLEPKCPIFKFQDRGNSGLTSTGFPDRGNNVRRVAA